MRRLWRKRTLFTDSGLKTNCMPHGIRGLKMDGETTRQVFLILSCVIMGVGLSACCGFKVFVPPLILSILAKAGLVGLSGNFAWLGTWTAIAVLSIATCTETVAYFWPLGFVST